MEVVGGRRLLSLARSNDARSAGGELRLWDLVSGAVLLSWPIERSDPTDLALSPVGLLVAVGVEEDARQTWRVLIYGLPPP